MIRWDIRDVDDVLAAIALVVSPLPIAMISYDAGARSSRAAAAPVVPDRRMDNPDTVDPTDPSSATNSFDEPPLIFNVDWLMAEADLLRAQAEAALAEENYCEVSVDDIENSPRFQDYPARRHMTRLRRPQLSTARAHTYRTALRQGIAEGPNFAGDSAVVTWGCGSGCFEWAIVNGRTGGVYFPPEEIAAHFGPSHFRDSGLQFRADSRLLIAVGSHLVLDPNARPRETWYEGAFFLLWNGRSLRPLRVVPVTDLCPDAGPPLLPSPYNDRREEPSADSTDAR